MPEWYRWERVDRGPTLELEPWVPKTVMQGEDAATSRICVCPTPELAFQALRACAPANPDQLILYRLLSGPQPAPATREQVPDAHRTGEAWILGRAVFVRVGEAGACSTGRT